VASGSLLYASFTVIARRTFLRGVTQVAALSALGGLAPLLRAWQSANTLPDGRLIVRSRSPQDLETPVGLLRDWITPNEIFFVRSHLPTPNVEIAKWALTVNGSVERRLTLSLDDLMALPRVDSVVTLECAGNGRAFFDPPVAGVQWQKGAVGTSRWTGVRLADVLQRAGVKATANFVLFDGADRPVGTVPDFVRTIPMAKAMHRDTLLAFEMNGSPLPAAHGLPLRAIVPGWEGAYWVKWLTTIDVLDGQHDGFFVQTAYRYPRRPVAPGTVVAASDMDPLTGLTVKSLIVTPAEGAALPLDRIRVTGFAWAGEADIARVDVSMDGGRSWQRASLGRERSPYAWRAFDHEWRVRAPGAYTLLARATDTRGRVQNDAPSWNPSGYLWNAVDRVTVTLGTAAPPAGPPPAVRTELPSDSDVSLVRQKCLVCHDADLIAQQRLSEAGWSREIDKMIRWGASLTDDERGRLLGYVVRHFPSR
jgi:DMSO/TMAO reductase YedYZ molybdopterin-dependent catalytic subunit